MWLWLWDCVQADCSLIPSLSGDCISPRPNTARPKPGYYLVPSLPAPNLGYLAAVAAQFRRERRITKERTTVLPRGKYRYIRWMCISVLRMLAILASLSTAWCGQEGLYHKTWLCSPSLRLHRRIVPLFWLRGAKWRYLVAINTFQRNLMWLLMSAIANAGSISRLARSCRVCGHLDRGNI